MSGLSKNLSYILTGEDKSASSTLKNFVDNGIKGAKLLADQLAVVGGAAIAAGTVAVRAAMAEQDAQTKLAVAVKDTGSTYALLTPRIDAAEASGRKLGFTNVDTTEGLTTLTTALGSGSKALTLINLAMDISAAKNISLSAASLLVAKASEGQQTALTRQGISLPIVASSAEKVAVAQQALATAQDKANAILKANPRALDDSSAAHAKYETALTGVSTAQTKLNQLQDAGSQIITALQQKFGGSAAASADTFSGKLKTLEANLENIEVKIGNALLPDLEKLADWVEAKLMPQLNVLADWLAKTGIPGFEKFATHVLNFIAAVGPGNVAIIGGFVAALWKVNAALDANPVGAVILGIEALIVYGLLLENNWTRLQKKNEQLVSGFLTVSLNIADGIATVFDTLSNNVSGAINQMLVPLNDMLKLLHLPTINIPKINLAGAVGQAQNLLNDAGQGGITPGLTGGGGRTSDVKPLAAGGIITRPTYVLAGESGPEAFIPLNAGKLGVGGRSTNIEIHLHGQGIMTGTPAQLGQQFMTILINGARNGNSAKELRRALGIV